MTAELYIPPCCIDTQLPPLVKAGGPCSFFYSMGDWGVSRLWGALSCLVPYQSSPSLTVLVIAEVDEFLLRFIAGYMERGWIHSLILVTASDSTTMVEAVLSHHLANVCYCPSRPEAVHGSLWIRTDGNLSLAVLGPLYFTCAPSRHLCAYTASYTSSPVRVRQLFRPWRSIVRIHAVLKGSSPMFNILLK